MSAQMAIVIVTGNTVDLLGAGCASIIHLSAGDSSVRVTPGVAKFSVNQQSPAYRSGYECQSGANTVAEHVLDRLPFTPDAQVGSPSGECRLKESVAARASLLATDVLAITTGTSGAFHFDLVPDLRPSGVQSGNGGGMIVDPAIDLADAIAANPMAFGPAHVARLRATGMDNRAIADLIDAASFFVLANRPVLWPGEPAATA
jgi:hypothetical protein